jgi:hydrogenase-4 transcriptional activator
MGARKPGKPDMSLESQLWREVCQHLELEESVQRVFDILAEHVPVVALVIRRLDLDPLRLTTVAMGTAEHGDAQADARKRWPSRTDLDRVAARELTHLLDQKRLAIVSRREPFLAEALVPKTVVGTVIAMPLAAGGKPVGVALLLVDPEVNVGHDHLDILAPAAWPLGVAFENDLRLHELARMREALEADREALLSRLERQDISEVVIGELGGLSNVMQRVEQVAKTDAPVLVLGETGSGKEVIARAIHSRSRRSKGPVVRINCGAIPSELVDSELFGHERGSFTGAVATRKGWFERADGGTLFLDEIGELPLAAQVRLLRVLQDGTLERVGGTQTISVDVRIVAATHRHLETMVAEGTFREDLWYRLSVFPVRLPALRERTEDIQVLASHFADRAGKRLGGAPLTLTASDIELLHTYQWPGNVRELAAVIERAAILGNGRRLELRTALGSSTEAPPARPTPGRTDTSRPPAQQAAAVRQDHQPGRRHGQAHRARARSLPRPHRGPLRRRQGAGHQPAHAARAHAQAGPRVAEVPRGRRAAGAGVVRRVRASLHGRERGG